MLTYTKMEIVLSNSDPKYMRPSENELLFLTDEGIRQHIELLFFAYKSFTADPDRILEKYGLGRAHHRALHFINSCPGLTVSELLDVLGITKQSLNRVLRRLIELEYVQSEIGSIDRRERNLSLTEKGRAFEQELSTAQRKRIREAFSKAGPEAVGGFRKVLGHIIDPSMGELVEKFGTYKKDRD